MKMFRILRCFGQMDMELASVKRHAQQQAGGSSDEAAGVGFVPKRMTLKDLCTRSTSSSVGVPPADVNEPTAVTGDMVELGKNDSWATEGASCNVCVAQVVGGIREQQNDKHP